MQFPLLEVSRWHVSICTLCTYCELHCTAVILCIIWQDIHHSCSDAFHSRVFEMWFVALLNLSVQMFSHNSLQPWYKYGVVQWLGCWLVINTSLTGSPRQADGLFTDEKKMSCLVANWMCSYRWQEICLVSTQFRWVLSRLDPVSNLQLTVVFTPPTQIKTVLSCLCRRCEQAVTLKCCLHMWLCDQAI